MTRALRRRHHTAVMVLAIALPAGVAVALAVRPVLPPVGPVVASRASTDDRPLRIAWQSEHDDGLLGVVVRVGWTDAGSDPLDPTERALDRTSTRRDAAAAGASDHGPVLDLDVAAHVAEPELLAYWAPGSPPSATQLGDGAVLLGRAGFGSRQRFALPDAARTVAGSLLLFSLAQGSIAADVALPAAERLPGRGEGLR